MLLERRHWDVCLSLDEAVRHVVHSIEAKRVLSS